MFGHSINNERSSSFVQESLTRRTRVTQGAREVNVSKPVLSEIFIGQTHSAPLSLVDGETIDISETYLNIEFNFHLQSEAEGFGRPLDAEKALATNG